MAIDELRSSPRDQIGELGRLLPINARGVQVRIVEPVHALSMRLLSGGADAMARTLASIGIAPLPRPGCFVGVDTLALWRNPTELLLVTPERSVADAVMGALAPGPHALAIAVDQSDGLVTMELRGPSVDDMLHRLLDAASVPLEPGRGTRARMADIAVFALRLAPDRAWLIADRANDRYLAHWMAYAADALSVLP